MNIVKKSFFIFLLLFIFIFDINASNYSIEDFKNVQNLSIQYRNSVLFNNKIIVFDNKNTLYTLDLTDKSLTTIQIEDNYIEELFFITNKNMNDFFLASYAYEESDSCSPYVCYKIKLVKFDLNGNKVLSKDFDGKYISFNYYDSENQIYLVTFTDSNNSNYALFLDKDFNELYKIELSYEAIDNFVIFDNYLIASFTNGILKIYSYPDFEFIKSYSCPDYNTLTKIDDKYVILAGNYGGLVKNLGIIQVYSISDILNSINNDSETLPNKSITLKDFYGNTVRTYYTNGNIYLFAPDYDNKKVRVFLLSVDEQGAPVVQASSAALDMDYVPIPDVDQDKVITSFNNSLALFTVSSDYKYFQISSVGLNSIKLSEAKEIDIDSWETGYPDPIYTPFAFYGVDGYTETVDNEKFFKYFTLDTAAVRPVISLPVYDKPCDVYLLLLNDTGLKFISSEGFTDYPSPLFSDIEGGFYYDFGNILLQYLPQGKYYVLIRKAESDVYDFDNPGFILKYIFNW